MCPQEPRRAQEKPRLRITQPGPCPCEQNCKPGSVFDSHLSRRTVASTLKPPLGSGRASLDASNHGVAPDRVYSDGHSRAVGCALTAPFHPYLTPYGAPKGDMRRYLSVALFLKSPSAGVTRYPCPVEPGLSSRPAFRPGRATVCLTRLSILAESDGIVNAWPQCGLHIGGSRQGLPLKIPDGPQSAARSRLHGPAALGEKVWEGEGRGCIFFRSAV